MKKELIGVLPPPKKMQIKEKSKGWISIEKEIGTALPADYKWFIETYGSGEIGNFVKLWNPFLSNKYQNLIERVKEHLKRLRLIRSSLPEEVWEKEVPYPLYPENEGLLPFGSSINGDVFYWQTKGIPDEWHIIINQVRSPIYEYHPTNLTNFLYMLMRGTVSTFINETDFDRTAGFKKTQE